MTCGRLVARAVSRARNNTREIEFAGRTYVRTSRQCHSVKLMRMSVNQEAENDEKQATLPPLYIIR